MVDLSVATLIGLSSMTAMMVWNPNQFAAQGRLYSEQASMQDRLTSVLSSLGVAWLHSATPSAICAALLAMSNATVELSAAGRGYICSTGPPSETPNASLTLEFAEGDLTLRAWLLVGP
jgi:hypothetical protein